MHVGSAYSNGERCGGWGATIDEIDKPIERESISGEIASSSTYEIGVKAVLCLIAHLIKSERYGDVTAYVPAHIAEGLAFSDRAALAAASASYSKYGKIKFVPATRWLRADAQNLARAALGKSSKDFGETLEPAKKVRFP